MGHSSIVNVPTPNTKSTMDKLIAKRIRVLKNVTFINFASSVSLYPSSSASPTVYDSNIPSKELSDVPSLSPSTSSSPTVYHSNGPSKEGSNMPS